MLAIINAYIAIALRRLGPEDLPASDLLLLATAAAYVFASLMLPLNEGGQRLALLAINLALVCSFTLALLQFAGHPGRYRQTLTALLGTGTLLTFVLLPFQWLLVNQPPGGNAAILGTAGVLTVILWSIVINGHIFARALSAPFGAGLLVSIGYFFLGAFAVATLRPGQP
ncbi:MAG: hypothetical protein JJT85_02335 [Chromatiales bacterium]|nr:hypothetical protein [Chromatiales bacterium]